MDATISPVAIGFGDEPLFNHGSGIREMQLEHMPTRLDVEADGERVGVGIEQLAVGHEVVLGVEGHALGEFEAASGTDGEQQRYAYLGISEREHIASILRETGVLP